MTPIFVDWIEIKEDCYIPLGIYPTERLTYKLRIAFLDKSWDGANMAFYVRNQYNSDTQAHGVVKDRNNYYGWFYNQYNYLSYDPRTTAHTYEAAIVNGKWRYSIDNGAYSKSYDIISSFTSAAQICLGRLTEPETISPTAKGHIKFVGPQVFGFDNTPVLDLHPCLYNGEYGLWDTLSNTFYGNSGTGTITGGYDE